MKEEVKAVEEQKEDLPLKIKELSDRIDSLSQKTDLEPGSIVQTDNGKLKIVDKDTKELRNLTKEEMALILEGDE